MFLLTILPWLRSNWRVILILALAGSLYGIGRYDGAKTVKARWTAALLQEQIQGAHLRQVMQDQANAQSVGFQKELAAKKKTINHLSRELKNEVAVHYSGCTAGDDIVGLWGKTFVNADGDNSPP